ncbi:MAG: hypothetical protein H6633_16665 [Anaerolineales bacterium]|nr:hypothetical protein [Anaerolineales bacterium]
MKKFPKKITVQAAVHPETANQIRAAANREEISVSELIRRILEEIYPAVQYVKREDRDQKKMMIGLREAA